MLQDFETNHLIKAQFFIYIDYNNVKGKLFVSDSHNLWHLRCKHIHMWVEEKLLPWIGQETSYLFFVSCHWLMYYALPNLYPSIKNSQEVMNWTNFPFTHAMMNMKAKSTMINLYNNAFTL